MLYIENGGVRAGILEDVGGRIVLLQKNDGKNILESHPALWNEAERLVAAPNNLEFRAYNGHEVWLGPQSEWWKHQTLNPEKANSDLFWPPDPYISFGKYNVVEHSQSRLVIEGEASPISGVRFIKTMFIDDCGRLHFSVEAVNVREEAVSWDLWMLTRVNGHCPSFVVVDGCDDVVVSEPTHPHQGPATYKVNNGCFYFTPEENDRSFEECTAKAFINPKKNFIASLVCQNAFLVVHFKKSEKSEIHKEQAEVELYNFATENASSSLMELECHAPYKTLNPGELMSAEEILEIVDYKGSASEDDLCRFVCEKIKPLL